MNSLHSLVPSWLHRRNDDMSEDEMPPLPTIAALPEGKVRKGGINPPPENFERPDPPPAFNADDRRKLIMSEAAGLVDEFKRDREASIKREQELQVQLAEAVLARQGDAKKIELLELDLASALNDKAALESQVSDYKHFFSNLQTINEKVKKVLESFGVPAPVKEKKPRKTKKSGATEVAPNDQTT